jgi:nitrite reductase/ring-hydroxylating ferredoxin subunit
MLGALRREQALTVYPVKVEEGQIWVNVPDDGSPAEDE